MRPPAFCHPNRHPDRYNTFDSQDVLQRMRQNPLDQRPLVLPESSLLALGVCRILVDGKFRGMGSAPEADSQQQRQPLQLPLQLNQLLGENHPHFQEAQMLLLYLVLVER
jgi:hypothetical protein